LWPGLLLMAVLMHQRPAAGGADQHLARAGLAMFVGILARLVDIEAMMRVLHRGNADAAADELGDQPYQEGGLAAAAEPDHSEKAHGGSRAAQPAACRGGRAPSCQQEPRSYAQDRCADSHSR